MNEWEHNRTTIGICWLPCCGFDSQRIADGLGSMAGPGAWLLYDLILWVPT